MQRRDRPIGPADGTYARVMTMASPSSAQIVRSLRDEAWGVRRFFVRDPDGRVVNVLTRR